MKFLHLSDLHLGKRVNEFSMLEDQAYILNEIVESAGSQQVDGIWIAGDIYDKPVPPAEAVRLFDDFLTRLAEMHLPVFIISGNHDSAERIAFGSRMLDTSGIYLSPVYDGWVEPVVLSDQYGEIAVYLLPFIKPAMVRRLWEEEPVDSYQDALRAAIAHMEISPQRRNVLLAHQFVTGAQRCESEEVSVGGLDNVDADVFEPFDYVALGHLHGPQWVGRETICYCGSPLKYSFSEAGQQKSALLVELAEKGRIEISRLPLKPLRDMREIKGSYMELTARDSYLGTNTDDYLRAILTDEEDIPNAMDRLRTIYPNLMRLDYDNRRTRSVQKIQISESTEQREPLSLLEEFYRLQNNQSMSPEQESFSRKLMEEIWEGQL